MTLSLAASFWRKSPQYFWKETAWEFMSWKTSSLSIVRVYVFAVQSQMPESQRKARDAPSCSRFCGRLGQLLSCRPLVTPAQVCTSTTCTLSQGNGWQPFRGSGRGKSPGWLQHCQQKPRHGTTGILAPPTREGGISGGMGAAIGAMASAPITDPTQFFFWF